MRKRQKLVLTAVLLSIGLVAVQSAPLEWRYLLIALLSGVSWLLSAWALREGLLGVEWLTVPLPMALFSAAVGLFYILLPESVWAKLMIFVLFGIGQYALLLTANIFSVAAIRTIALFRAASAVGFVMTLLTGFFMFDTIFSFRLYFWLVGLLVALTSFWLLLPGLWSITLEKRITKQVWGYSFWLAIMVGLAGMAITFWPISIAVSSLFLSTLLYIYLGVAQHHFTQRLFTKTVWEYVTVGVVVLVTMLITAGWGV
jgi:hypothetical protein